MIAKLIFSHLFFIPYKTELLSIQARHVVTSFVISFTCNRIKELLTLRACRILQFHACVAPRLLILEN